MMRSGRTIAGFTLVEVLAAIVVISIVGAVVLPVVTTLSRRQAEAATSRAEVQAMAHAADQVVRLLREAPTRSDGSLAIAASSAQGVRFVDGRGIEVDEGTLLLHAVGGRTGVLLENVGAFELRFMDEAGTAPASEPDLAWRIRYRIDSGGETLAGTVFPRARLGGGGA